MTTTPHTVPGSPLAAGPVDPVGADLLSLLRTLKLSGMKDTLPERLSLAKSRQLSHHQFLEQLLSDEVSRREARSAAGRAARAGLLPLMRLDTWTEPPDLIYDRQLLSDLTTLRFVGTARLRVDDDLLITDAASDTDGFAHGFARLAGYRMIDGELHAHIEPVEQTDRRRAESVDTSGVALLTRLAGAGGTALLSAKPYLRSASKAYFGPRWSAGRVPTDRRVTRAVPLDVLLAGA
ncbi:ATP-binding protein [Nakamurella sp.]|uniref:ATP-binding protein n=1 Tax=Nakamurella sp. TaxID=1869182 RepID=UPI003B3B665C